jgi:hypothetical protein
LSLFRRNPEDGLKLVQGNEELQAFIKDFCGILGEHFTSMAENTVRTKNVIMARCLLPLCVAAMQADYNHGHYRPMSSKKCFKTFPTYISYFFRI